MMRRIFLMTLMLLFSCIMYAQVTIIPKPVHCKENVGFFEINTQTRIIVPDKSQLSNGNYLVRLLKLNNGVEVSRKSALNSVFFTYNRKLPKEGYRLTVEKNNIKIQASGGAGFFYAIQSLRQMLPVTLKQGSKSSDYKIPCLELDDNPRFSWRGMHLDFSRHFFSLSEVKDFLDHMALYKMNKFHMHLTDDQGWRVEIKKYPELTANGAFRKPSRHDVECNKRAKHDKLLEIDSQKFIDKNGEQFYGGFFTQEDIKEIITWASERYIEVIPEVDVPGHFRAAMDQYPNLTCFGKSGQGISNANRSIPACLGNENAYRFIKDVLFEIGDLFPSRYIHIGGDEVLTENWEKCPKCQKVIEDKGLNNEHELQSYFNQRIEKDLKKRGKKVIGWDEIVLGGISKGATMMWWRNWHPEAVKKALKNGNEMIFTPLNPYYFDYVNGADGMEKVYNYSSKIIPEYFSDEQAKLVKGIQGCLWSEYLPNVKRMQYMAFPRLLALAETAWSPLNIQNINDFKSRLQSHYARFDALGINYALKKIEGIQQNMVFADSMLVTLKTKEEGAKIYYSLNGLDPLIVDSCQYSVPIKIGDNVTLKAVAVKNGKKDKVYRASILKQEIQEAISSEAIAFKGLNYWSFNTPLVPDDYWLTSPENISKIIVPEPTDGNDHSLMYKGYIQVDKDGLYTITTGLRGESYVTVDDCLIVKNTLTDGVNKGQVVLRAGIHKIDMCFEHVKSGSKLKVTFEGEDKKKLSINDLIY
ncbi:hypothetical protein EYV94_09575 [Puteibacter caeruleilacunae]|nr:hypothetical protein EYV94_09575 [Puteibacter caeruleilacunae]